MVDRSVNSGASLPGSETCLPFNSFETLGKLAVLCVSVSSSVGTMIVPTSEGVTSIKWIIICKALYSFNVLFLSMCVLSHPAVSDSATTWTAACQASLSMGHCRQEYWSGLPFPSLGDLPGPGIKPESPALQADSLPLSHPGSPVKHIKSIWHTVSTI